MWFEMRPVELDFLERAPRIYTVECEVAAPRSAVWDAYADPATWSAWFPGVRSASYPDDRLPARPPGVGTRREATVSGQRYEERMLAWDVGERWAYRIERATLPLAHAQVECTHFEDSARGTRVRWVLAADPRLLLWLASPVFGRIQRRLFTTAMQRFERYMQGPSSGSRSGQT